jgi:hypothetical protein
MLWLSVAALVSGLVADVRHPLHGDPGLGISLTRVTRSAPSLGAFGGGLISSSMTGSSATGLADRGAWSALLLGIVQISLAGGPGRRRDRALEPRLAADGDEGNKDGRWGKRARAR